MCSKPFIVIRVTTSPLLRLVPFLSLNLSFSSSEALALLLGELQQSMALLHDVQHYQPHLESQVRPKCLVPWGGDFTQ